MGFLHNLGELIKARSGLHIFRSTLPWGTSLQRDLISSGLWNDQGVIFDVGAHLGKVTLAFHKTNPAATIHCFEPASSNFSQLQVKLAGLKQVVLWQLALSSHEGPASLHIKKSSTTHSLVNGLGACGTEQVEVQTLDAFCARHSINHIHFLKVDTEGADLDVLKGAEKMLVQGGVDFIQVETTTRKDVTGFAPFDQVDAFLQDHSYELFGFYDQQPCWSQRQSLLYLNAVYVRVSLIAGRPVG